MMKAHGKLGFGCMRLPRINNNIDLSKTELLFDYFLDNGFSYFDTAFIYDGSEQILRKALVERHNRDSYQIASKIPLYLVSEQSPMEQFFEKTLSRLGTQFLDSYLLHGLDDFWCDQAEKLDAFSFLSALKKAGDVKSIGFSFHGSPNKLEEVLTNHPEVDFVQLQINYVDWFDPKIQSEKLYHIANSHSIPIIIMEPVKGGLLSNSQHQIFDKLANIHHSWSIASWAMRFVNSLEGVSTVLSGMNKIEQIKDNIEVFKYNLVLSESDRTALFEFANYLRSIPRVNCTACGYCTTACPKNIKIPIMIELFNDYSVYKSLGNFLHMYKMYTEDGTIVDSCIHCKSCERRCPQKIQITGIISEISDIVSNNTNKIGASRG